MRNIRELSFLNKSNLKKLKPYLSINSNNFMMRFLSISPFSLLHKNLPQKYKFLDESYILKEGKETGIITVSPIKGNSEKVVISQLYLSKKSQDIAEQLVNFIVQKYGEKGVSSFYIAIDDAHSELIQILLSKCCFRQCSTHKIWKVGKKNFKKSKTLKYRRYRDSDLKEISDIYNDSLITYFKPTLNRDKKEFAEFLCYGLTHTSDYRYVIEDSSSGRVIGYFLISTTDNSNYMVDFNFSDGYEIDIDGIMNFTIRELLKRQRRFKLYVKIKNYLRTAEIQEKYALTRNFKHKKTNLVLVKDFYKQIKNKIKTGEYAMAMET